MLTLITRWVKLPTLTINAKHIFAKLTTASGADHQRSALTFGMSY